MTSAGFLSLYYTDCRPGQGLRGGAGFQFQAVSAGVGHDAMTLVQRSALYEAPVAWMREHRAADSYPPSLTHVFDGVYVTARGVYLGAEANGVREGNQFTHAVSTTDPEAYGLIRPAQLWDAPWWSEQPAAGTECDPVAAQPEQGPWGIDAIREWVLGQPNAEDWLVAVSSAFERAQGPNRRRVLFVGEDAAQIVGWIAAGTLLLPQIRALRLGFRVFATSPHYSQHDVLALHPDWAGALANPDREGEFVVFSLGSGRHSAVEHTEAAEYWVPRFLQVDPFDVVDAIELAHRFARQRHPRTDAATAEVDVSAGSDDRLASAVVMFGEPVQDEQQAGALAEWLSRQPPPAPEDVVEPVARAVLAATAEVGTLAELDGAVRLHGLRGEVTGRIRAALLAAEVDGIVAGRPLDADAPPLPRHEGTPAERLNCAAVVERAATLIPPDRMDSLLRLAVRFGVEPSVPNFLDAAHRFVSWWADHPGAGLDPDTWPRPAMLIDLLRDELARRPDTAALRGDVRQHWWQLLLPVLDLSSALDASVAAAVMERGSPQRRHEVIGAVLEFAQRRDRPDTADLAWDALFRYGTPSTDQLIALLRRLRRETTSATFAAEVCTVLGKRCRSQVGVAELDALALLADLGRAPTDGPLAVLWQQNVALQRWLTSVPAHPSDRRAAVAEPGVVAEKLLRAHQPQVLRVMLDRVPLGQSPGLIDRAGEGLQYFLVAELPALWNDGSVHDQPRRGDRAVALSYIAITARHVPYQIEARYSGQLKRWVRSAEPDRLRRVGQLLSAVEAQLSDEWQRAVADALPRRRAASVRKPPAGGPGSADKQAPAKPAKSTAGPTKTVGWLLGRIRGGK